MQMIKNIAWNLFKNTGDINSFMEYKQIENIEMDLQKVELNEYSKNEGDNNFGK
jgi:hypothetical protein